MEKIKALEARLIKRYRQKKILNIAISLLVFVLSITAFWYKAVIIESGNFLTCFREMTMDSGLFSGLICLLYAFIGLLELRNRWELTSHVMYYLRLSAAVAGCIVLIVVLVGYLPFVPAHPVIGRYDMLNMHVLVPLLMVASFTVNDAPIGRLSPKQRLGGLVFVALYTVLVLYHIWVGVIPERLIPYFFLNIRHQPAWFSALALIAIYSLAYALSWGLSELNRKLSWIWYRRK